MLSFLKALNWVELGQAILMILGGASILAKLTPTNKDDKILNFILKIIHALGLTKKDEKKK